MMEGFPQMLADATDVGDVFDVVKAAVRESLGRGRAGLMLGLAPLGFAQEGFIGAYHQVGSNLIVMNANLLKKIEQENPEQLKNYTFHLLLHEYLHSLGIVDEERCRAVTELVSKETFGEDHIIAKIAENFEAFLPNMKYAEHNFQPPNQADITLVPGFDKDGTRYIG